MPPDMRILTPGLRFFSSSSTRRPHSAARMAASSPAAPAPTTTTSQIVSAMRERTLYKLVTPIPAPKDYTALVIAAPVSHTPFP